MRNTIIRPQIIAALASAVLASPLRGAVAAEARPNVILILADDFGPGDLSCYGGTLAETPHLDRMAREGVRFTQFYVASPICSPSRCGIITGQWPARHRITSYLQTRAGNAACGQADFLDPAAPSLPRTLKDGRVRDAARRQVAPRRRPRRGRSAEVRRVRLRPRARDL